MGRDLIEDKDYIVKSIYRAEADYLDYIPASAQDKGDFDIVTATDYKIEEFLKERIQEKYPDDIIMGEESSPFSDLKHSACWTIDPIDGTVNYAHGIPLYGIQVALIEDYEIVLSVIYLPKFEQMYWAVKGCGAHKIEGIYTSPLHPTMPDSPKRALINLGDIPHHNNTIQSRQIKVIEYLSDKVLKVRMYGAACFDFVSLATGKAHGYMVFTTNLWDICPGILLCKEAGLSVKNLNGDDYRLGDDGIIIGTTKKIEELLLSSLS